MRENWWLGGDFSISLFINYVFFWDPLVEEMMDDYLFFLGGGEIGWFNHQQIATQLRYLEGHPRTSK